LNRHDLRDLQAFLLSLTEPRQHAGPPALPVLGDLASDKSP
jgi:hypothetical protein